VVKPMKAYEVRSYIPEKRQKGRRNWAGKQAEQQAVYANRRRVWSDGLRDTPEIALTERLSIGPAM
jgi:hypothetical protein